MQITRRNFLKTAFAGGGGMALAGREIGRAVANGLTKLGTPPAWFHQGEIKTTYNYCDMCPWKCGIVVQTVGDRVRKIDGNPLDPKSRGMLCARGQGGVSFVYDPDRLRAPMVRTGERGAGKFQEITWNDAFDQIAEKLQAVAAQYGPESVAILGHTTGDFWFTDYFAQAWGTPNAGKPSATLCTSPRDEAALLTTGVAIGGHEPMDWDAMRCIVLMGSHIGEDTRNTVMQDFMNAWGNGAKVIVIDPRFSSAAAKADYWLPIKPGTDTALLLAWINVLIAENLYNREYVEQWTEGFEQLAAHVQEFTPEWAAAITELDPELIRTTARVIAEAAPAAAIMPGRHTTWYGNDTQRMRAAYIINTLAGAWGNEGGLYFNKSPYLEAYPHPPFAITGSAGGCSAEPGAETAELPAGPSGKIRADGARTKFLRGATAIQELIEPMITGEPYPIKALIVYGVNLLNSIPNPERTLEALKKLDLVVVIDVLPQEHVAWADYVLPEASYLERYDELSAVAYKTPFIQVREPAIAPMYDTKPGWWMARELGMRVGLEKYFAWETIEEYLNTRLMSIGSNLEKMHEAKGVVIQKGKPYLADFNGASPFGTPSGKIQLFSDELAVAKLGGLPEYEPTAEPPEGYFRLTYGRQPVHTFAKTQNTPVLNEITPENEVWINEDVANGLGIRHGDRVWLENEAGTRTGPVKVKSTQRIRPDLVFLAHGFGSVAPGLSRANGKGASDARLMSQYKLDPISGGAGMRINFVRLVKEA
ncbi:MAG: molybdopterin-dependent oxidoreductase [Anaerolineales bacterium]|nr:molybdopterin-dependent oxidoreductase [Anaerolineales bacterium]